jgi:hypothetical protein
VKRPAQRFSRNDAGFVAEVLPVFRVQDLHTRELAADGAVKMGSGIMRVDHIDLFRARKARNLPEEPPIQAGYRVAKRDDMWYFATPGTRFFQTTNDEAEFLGSILDQVHNNSFQPAHAQAEYDLHHGFRRRHGGHASIRQISFCAWQTRTCAAGASRA